MEVGSTAAKSPSVVVRLTPPARAHGAALLSAQALADYAVIIAWLRSNGGDTESAWVRDPGAAVVAVGGSYGGMLAGWLRYTYPASVAGAIAASAPIWGLPLTAPPLDGSAVATSRGFGTAGGAPERCADHLLAAWPVMEVVGRTQAGRDLIADALDLCDPLETTAQVAALSAAIQNTFFDLSEGDYPFPSTYITSAVGPGTYPLPAWPMRVACAGLAEDLGISIDGDTASVAFTVTALPTDPAATAPVAVSVSWGAATGEPGADDVAGSGIPALLRGVKQAYGVWCNVTGELACFPLAGCGTGAKPAQAEKPAEEPAKEPAEPPSQRVDTDKAESADKVGGSGGTCSVSTLGGSWEAVCCNDDMNLVNYLVTGAGRDVYWPPSVVDSGWQALPYDEQLTRALGPYGEQGPGCASRPGVFGYPARSDPWSAWMDASFGGLGITSGASNIIFSNGLLDPWSAAGVYPGAGPPPPGPYDGPVVLNLTADGALQAVVLDLGAHHLDLMFMDDNDPPCAAEARDAERAAIEKWAAQFRAAHGAGAKSRAGRAAGRRAAAPRAGREL